MQNLVETMYNSSGGEKVTIVVHSMGGIVSLYFLNEVVTQEWKDQYINAWVTLSGAWSGGVGGLGTVISDPFQEAYRTFEGLSWLLPKPYVWNNTVLVTSTSRNYTANDYEDLFRDIGYPQGYQMYLGIVSLNENYPAPRVPIHCLYGVNVPTPESFTYGNGFDANPTNINYGDGDGTVNLQGSEVCLKWQNEQTEPFSTLTFPGVHHRQMVTNTDVLETVAEIVGAPEPSPTSPEPSPTSPSPTSTAVSAAASLTVIVGSIILLTLM